MIKAYEQFRTDEGLLPEGMKLYMIMPGYLKRKQRKRNCCTVSEILKSFNSEPLANDLDLLIVCFTSLLINAS